MVMTSAGRPSERRAFRMCVHGVQSTRIVVRVTAVSTRRISSSAVRNPCAEIVSDQGSASNGSPGVMNKAGKAMSPVKPSTINQTRFARRKTHTGDDGVDDCEQEQSSDHLEPTADHNGKDEGEDSDDAYPGIEFLKQSGLGRDILRHQGSGQGIAESAKGRLQENAAAHDRNSGRRPFAANDFTTNEARSRRPTPKSAERKYPNAGFLTNEGA